MRKKLAIFTEEAEAFADTLEPLSRKKLAKTVELLEVQGFLRSPLAEKVEGVDNLFAIRILAESNARFFYCYDDGTTIYVLCGYSKRSTKIPRTELARAIEIRKGLGL